MSMKQVQGDQYQETGCGMAKHAGGRSVAVIALCRWGVAAGSSC